MSIFRNKKILIMLIFIIALFLRLYQLGQNPPSLTWDEVAWGYNAYTLGIDGKDEFGRFLPITYLESFGDFKPPLYAYLDILPVKFLGLNEFAIRFPSAFLGAITVLLTYFLVKKIFVNRKVEIALLSSFLLAISPWHLMLSRAAFEANIATFFIILGMFLFFYSLEKNKWFIILSLISFVLSMYTFNTARIVIPILLPVVFFFKRKDLFSMKKMAFSGIVLAFILFLPLGLFMNTPQAKLRFQEVNIFSDLTVIQRQNVQIVNDNNSKLSNIIHNRRFAFSVEYLRHYFDHLNPYFLFIKGDGNPKFSIQDVGQLYLWEIPFFAAGILFLFRKKEGNWWIIPVWLLIGIIPAATARETPHALRIESTLPTFQILTVYGLYNIYLSVNSVILNTFRKKLYQKYIIRSLFLIFAIFVLINFAYFYHNYFNHYPKEFSGEWQYGYKEAINYIQSVESNYEKIYFTDALGRPYIYFLLYTKYNPDSFRKEAMVQREVFGFVHVNGFGKYRFGEDLKKTQLNERILYINAVHRVPQNAEVKKEFYLLNGQKALVAYTL